MTRRSASPTSLAAPPARARRLGATLFLLLVLVLMSARARADGAAPKPTLGPLHGELTATRAQADDPPAPGASLVCPQRCCTPCDSVGSARQPTDESTSTADETSGTARTVDLNKADESALLDLPGIGPARARAILAYRVSHGAFHSIVQLLHIKGIGRSLLKQLRPLVTVSGHPS